MRHPSPSCQANRFLRIVRPRFEGESRRAIARDQELTVTYQSTHHLGGRACGCGRPRCHSRL